MDMKRILQALDNTSTKPVEGANDMKKFMSVVTEGANPHKVALPVQMAMQHYQLPKAETKVPLVVKTPLLKKYFQETEEIEEQALAEKRERLRMYSQTIAERVLMKESALKDKEDLKAKRKALQDIQLDPNTHKDPELKAELIRRKAALEKEAKSKQLDESPIEMTGDANDPTVYGHQQANPMSLKGRIQQARNQLKELANMAESDELLVWEKITRLSKGGMFMGLEQNLEQIRHGIAELAAKRKQGGIASRGIDKQIGEDEDPCWDNYKQVGMKKKGGKKVTNCVPKE